MKMRFYALWLSAICFGVFILQLFVERFTTLFILDRYFSYQIWRFVTALFLHGSLSHLIVNVFALALFGTILESFVGSRKFILIFFTSGIIANIIAVNYYPVSLGASGAIYGILGALVLLRPMLVVWVYGLPMPMFVAGAVWLVNDLVGLFLPSDIGHIAHLSGIAVGVVFGIFYRGESVKKEKRERVRLHEGYMRRWEDVHLK